jgi:hypothetical protein
MPGGFAVSIAFLDKRNNTRTQLDRMRLAHGGSPSMGKLNHRSIILRTLNQVISLQSKASAIATTGRR